MAARSIAFRDKLAHRLANAALRIATPWYRGMIRGSIRYGLAQLAIGESHSCNCGRVTATMPIGRQPCCGQ